MQVSNRSAVRSAINVTPLVDVVLVLLIIFMVITPQLQSGPGVDLPVTDRPQDRVDEGRRIVVTLDRNGAVWVDDEPVPGGGFAEHMRGLAEGRSDWSVVIKGDAALSFGDVRRAMLVVDAAGYKNVGLIAERREGAGESG